MREHYDDTQVEVAMSADAPVLCLASASPRRQTLLSSIGVHACVMPSDIDETPLDAELPEAYVERLAVAKVQAAVGKTPLPVLGSDTAVVIDGVILGKPNDQQHAAEMLHMLSGRTHQVLTAVAVSGPRGILSCSVATNVTMRALTAEEIACYWLTGEPADKAGGYAIQGLAAVFIEHIQGSHSAVVGLPIFETTRLLRQQGVPVWAGRYPS